MPRRIIFKWQQGHAYEVEITDYQTPRHINEIVKGKRAITADTALRLGRFFKTSPEFWINLQSHYALEIESDKLEKTLEKERPFQAPPPYTKSI